MNYRSAIQTFAALVAVALTGCGDQNKSVVTTTTYSVQDTIEGTITATVKAIDQQTRVVTLQDNDGDQITLRVDSRVRRLNEVMVGDNVYAKYNATLTAELRPPTEEERMHPMTVIQAESRSPQGSTPAGSVSDSVKVVTTVEAVDASKMLVTLRGPLGNSWVVKGRNKDIVKTIKVGDTIVITFTNSVAMSLEKVAPR